jgi:hypothetical protein
MMTTSKTMITGGSKIVHPMLGSGTVRRLHRDGRALMVHFDSHPRLLLEVKRREVQLARQAGDSHATSGTEAPKAGKQRPASSRAPRDGDARSAVERRPFRRPMDRADVDEKASDGAARTLEALRLGVVPSADLRPSSVGRDTELMLVGRDLAEADSSGAARVFLGDYGTGKTHLLELIEYEALAKGFLVGRATLDAQYVQPNKPMRVYRQLVSSLRYPNGNGVAGSGLEPLMRRATGERTLIEALENGKSPLSNHLYLRPALHYFKELLDLDDPVPRALLLDWLSGQRPEGNQELDATVRKLGRRGPTIYSLKDFQPWAHVYAYLLGGISVLARGLGYRGLVLLIDEAENYDLLGSAARVFADSLFRCLVLAALGTEKVLYPESSVIKGGFGPQRRLPLIFRRPQHLYLVFAMTPSTVGEQFLRRLVAPERLTELAPLTLDDYQELSQRLSALVQTAYPEIRLPERMSRPLAEILWAMLRREHIQSPREATKLTVEFLDLIRLRPQGLGTFLEDIERSLA